MSKFLLGYLVYYVLGVVVMRLELRRFMRALDEKYPMLPPEEWDSGATIMVLAGGMTWPFIIIANCFTKWPGGYRRVKP